MSKSSTSKFDIRSRSSNFLHKIPGTKNNFILSTYSSWLNNPQIPRKHFNVQNRRKKNFLTYVNYDHKTARTAFNSSSNFSKRLKTDPNDENRKEKFSQNEALFTEEASFERRYTDYNDQFYQKNYYDKKKKLGEINNKNENFEPSGPIKPDYCIENLRKKYYKKKKNLNFLEETSPYNLKSATSMPFLNDRKIYENDYSKPKLKKKHSDISEKEPIDMKKMKIMHLLKNLNNISKNLDMKFDPLSKKKKDLFREKLKLPNTDSRLRLKDGTFCNSREDDSKDEKIFIFEDKNGNEKLGFQEIPEVLSPLKKHLKTKTKAQLQFEKDQKKRLIRKLTRRNLKNLEIKLKNQNLNSMLASNALSPRGGVLADENFKKCQKLVNNFKKLREIKCNDDMIYNFFSKITGENSVLLHCFFDKNKKFNTEINEFQLLKIFNKAKNSKKGGRNLKKKKKINYRFPMSKRQYIHKVVNEREKDKKKRKQMEAEFKQQQIDELRLKGNIETELNMIPVMCQASQDLINQIQKETLKKVADEIVMRNNNSNKIIHKLRFDYSDYFDNNHNNLNKKKDIYPRAYFSRPFKEEKNPLREGRGAEFYEDPLSFKEEMVSCYRKVEKMLTPMVLRHHRAIQEAVGERNSVFGEN